MCDCVQTRAGDSFNNFSNLTLWRLMMTNPNISAADEYPEPIQTQASAVSWSAIVAGAAATAALSLILLMLGTGLELSSVSPWALQRRKRNDLRCIDHPVADLHATRCFRNGGLPRRQAENKVGCGAYGRGLLPRHRARLPVLGRRRACDRCVTHFGDWVDRQRWNSGWSLYGWGRRHRHGGRV